MTEYWVDYSAAKISGAAMASTVIGPNGERCTGAIRYIDSRVNLGAKHTSPSEYADLVSHGMKVRLVMQVNTTDADGGFNRGVAYAQRALDGASYIGYNTGVIFFTNDRTTLSSVSTWQAYLDGAASVLGRARVGAYGFQNAMNAAIGHASAFWQSGRESDLVGHANFYQWNNGRVYISGIECDRNRVISDYVPGGVPAVLSLGNDDEEDEMQPVLLPASPGVTNQTFQWDGRKAVLNVVATDTDAFIARPGNWGPNGGTGGGDPQQGLPAANDRWRVTVNLPGQFTIPAGTTRVFYSWSCATPHSMQIVPVA